jgi:hypothetical protein
MKRRVPIRFYTWASRAAYVALALTLTYCGQTTTTGPASGTFSAVYTNTLSQACIQCHVPTGAVYTVNQVPLDFTSQTTAYNTLTANKVKGQSSVGICGDVDIVKASHPELSYLAAVLFSDYSTSDFGGETGCTPYSVHHQDQHLSADEKTSLIKWITNGALNN